MGKKHKILLSAIMAVSLFILVMVFAWCDTLECREAVTRFYPIVKKGVQVSRNQLSDDLKITGECFPDKFVQAGANNKKMERLCLIEASDRIKTDMGALVISSRALVWIIQNGEDIHLRNAALRAINAGHLSIVEHQDEYQALSVLLIAKNNFLVASVLFDKNVDPKDRFHVMKQLDKVELALYQPKVFAEQSNRMIDLHNSSLDGVSTYN